MHDSKLPAVLVVEDEFLTRMDAVDMIRDAGFRTYEAGTADVAISLMERHGDIGILFTDIDLPGSMDGLELAAYVRDGWPPVEILIASGVVGIEKSDMPDGTCFFAKPYATRHVISELHNFITHLV